MANIWQQFQNLLPNSPLLIGRVVEITIDGAMVVLPSGEALRVRGTAALGQSVFFQGGVIQGNAPNFTAVRIDV